MSVLSSRRYLSVWLRRLSTDRIERRSSKPVETFVVVASIKSAQRITALTDGAARLGLKTGMGLADARAMYPACRSWTPIRRPIVACSKPSPIGATAIRRWSASIRRMACCSTSPVARICSAARQRSPAIWSRGSRSRVCAPASRLPTRSAAPGAWRVMASRASSRAARPKRPCCRCRSRRCASMPTSSPD